MKFKSLLGMGVAGLCFTLLLWGPAMKAEQPAVAGRVLKPVEDDMHEFMEYVFEPSFHRLKENLAKKPENNKAWKMIKADSLILAEGGNLLLFRGPKDEAEWIKHAEHVRASAGDVYKAGKAKDYAAARQSYEVMIKNCNVCHQAFADGEHQLTP